MFIIGLFILDKDIYGIQSVFNKDNRYSDFKPRFGLIEALK